MSRLFSADFVKFAREVLGIELTQEQAEGISQQIDEKANGSFHLDKVEVEYFIEHGTRAPDGITER